MSQRLELKTATIGGRNCKKHIDTKYYFKIAGGEVVEILASMVREIIWSHNIIIMESKSNIQTFEKVQTASAQTRKIFGEPNKFAQKSETESRKFNLLYYASWLPLSWYHHAISPTASAKSELRFKERQTKAELRNNSPQRTQRAQSTGIFKIFFEKTLTPRRRIRMKQIRRIFADPSVSASSAQSVFHWTPSAFIRVHLRLIFVSLSDRTQKIKFELFPVEEKIELSNNNKAHSLLNLLKNKPQISVLLTLSVNII